MTTEWAFIESFAVIVEILAIVYFLNSRFASKNKSFLPQSLAWLIMSAWGLLTLFLGFHSWIYTAVTIVVPLVFLCYFKHGRLWQKILCVIVLHAVLIATSLIGAGIASMITDVNLSHTLMYQDVSRLLAIIFIKVLQVALLFVFAKKHLSNHIQKKKSTILLSVTVLIILVCNMLILSGVHDFDYGINRTMTWLALGFLAILVVALMLYEMFSREESSNLELAAKLQKLELESSFYKEIDAIFSEIRTLRHEYNNNMTALHKLIEHNENEKALDFIDGMSLDPVRDSGSLKTGNLVLDAVVSSKLWLARSKGIDVSIQAVYPENNQIDNNDLCAIVGNLLDNAVEACQRMEGEGSKKFIVFSLLTKGKNMTISISNSYEQPPIKDGDRFITNKDKRFHGIGLEYTDSIVDKYQGHVIREHADGIFETHVMIPLISAE